jgi:CCR4-NOT transcription complex subunit 2
MLPQHGGQPARTFPGPAKQPIGPPGSVSAPSLDSMLGSGGMYGGSVNYASSSDAKPVDYGLLGILPVIRAPQKESGPLAFGMELTALFPTISSPEPVHSTFAGPWAAGPIRREPDYQIPQAYVVTPPPKISDKIELFSDDTLFYIFYTMPKDIMQTSAARTLVKREWLYHKELKVWFKRVKIHDQTPTSETGTFVYMDTVRWEEVRKDNFTLEYDKLERSY